MKLEKYIDHTILSPQATESEVLQICEDAKKYGFMSVCVNAGYAEFVAKQLNGTDVKTCVVVGFPLGATLKEVKAYETEAAILKGADEIDMVINVGALKDCKNDLVLEDIKAVVEAARGKALVKVIIETCLLTEEEKIRACKLSVEAGADFVKTSTGFSTGGATAEDIALMRKTVGPNVGVKASGGVRNYEDAKAMIDAGATRIGASKSVAIIQGETVEAGY